MRNVMTILFTILALTTMIGAEPTAQKSESNHNKLAVELNLSADQQAKLTVIHKENVTSQKVLRNQLKIKKFEMNSID